MKCETAVVLVDPEVLRPGTLRLNAGQPERFVVRSLRRFAGRVAIHPFTGVAAFLKMLAHSHLLAATGPGACS